MALVLGGDQFGLGDGQRLLQEGDLLLELVARAPELFVLALPQLQFGFVRQALLLQLDEQVAAAGLGVCQPLHPVQQRFLQRLLVRPLAPGFLVGGGELVLQLLPPAGRLVGLQRLTVQLPYALFGLGGECRAVLAQIGDQCGDEVPLRDPVALQITGQRARVHVTARGVAPHAHPETAEDDPKVFHEGPLLRREAVTERRQTRRPRRATGTHATACGSSTPPSITVFQPGISRMVLTSADGNTAVAATTHRQHRSGPYVTSGRTS
ncbi:hypothetical protein [Streptomyces sp. NPDC059786]|uniref:hypothetical protein n=1 Tax=Streptomyces sp. NPDC059786 TaxID=3346946 RepID=UPI00364804F1